MARQGKPTHPFQRAVLRGIAVILPPLLTIVFLLWIWNSVQTYVLNPIETAAQKLLVQRVAEIHQRPPVAQDEDPGRPKRQSQL